MKIVPEMRDPIVLARRRAATASFHAKVAAAYRKVGREEDARVADKAAAQLRAAANGRP